MSLLFKNGLQFYQDLKQDEDFRRKCWVQGACFLISLTFSCLGLNRRLLFYVAGEYAHFNDIT